MSRSRPAAWINHGFSVFPLHSLLLSYQRGNCSSGSGREIFIFSAEDERICPCWWLMSEGCYICSLSEDVLHMKSRGKKSSDSRTPLQVAWLFEFYSVELFPALPSSFFPPLMLHFPLSLNLQCTLRHHSEMPFDLSCLLYIIASKALFFYSQMEAFPPFFWPFPSFIL